MKDNNFRLLFMIVLTACFLFSLGVGIASGSVMGSTATFLITAAIAVFVLGIVYYNSDRY